MDPAFWTVVANMGFPALVAGYLLFKLNGKVERLTESNLTLTGAVNRLAERIEEFLRK